MRRLLQKTDGNGNPYMQADVDPLQIERQSVIGLLRQKIYDNNKPVLPSDCVPARLRIFKTKDDAIGNTNPLAPGSVIGGLGAIEKSCLYVVVPVSVKRKRTKPEGIKSLPSEAGRVSQPEPTTKRLIWLPERPEKYSIESANLKFVNGTNAISMLMDIHRETFGLAMHDGVGPVFQIPLIDSLFGTGKSAFVYHYISEARKKLINVNTPFAQMLTRARCVTIRLKPCSLVPADSNPAASLRNQFIDALKLRVSKGELQGAPDFLNENLSSLRSITEVAGRLIEETGTPLFLVLDEIGSAFTSPSLSLIEQRSRFLDFCHIVLSPCLMRIDLFLLLIGKAEFLSLVANRTPCSPRLAGSEIRIARIGLNMIRRDNIMTILDETYRGRPTPNAAMTGLVSDSSSEPPPPDIEPLTTIASEPVSESEEPVATVSDLYLIGNKLDPRRDRARDAILDATNGHPRSIFQMLASCATYEQLLTYEPPDAVSPFAVEDWVRELMAYSAGVMELMDMAERGTPMDLGQVVFKGTPKSMTYAQIADRARFRYEGPIEASRLFASKFVKRHLAVLFLPFRSFLMQLNTSTPLRYNHEGNFELCCLRRFQEMFGGTNERKPVGTRYPLWFEGTIFGSLEAFRLNQSVCPIPKITVNGSRTFEKLDQATAIPALWPNIVNAMRSQPSPCNFLPADLSASSDVFLVTQAIRGNEKRTVTVGLAVKCIKDPLSMNGRENSVHREKVLFDRMFMSGAHHPSLDTPPLGEPLPDVDVPCSSDSEPRMGMDLNILIVCSSGGYCSVEPMVGKYFVHLGFDEEFPRIHETILLDLSSRKKREHFFGLQGDQVLADKVESIVRKENPSRSSPI